MTALAFAGVAAAMLADWWAVTRRVDRMEAAAKPLVMILLIGVVLTADGAAASVRLSVLAALALAAIGDVLLLPQIDRFIAGLVAFVGTHVAYLAAFVASGIAPVLLVAGALVATAGAVAVGRPIVAGATRRDEQLGRAVVGYIVVLAAMWAAAIAVGDVFAIVGATLFVASDAVLGWNRFVEAIPHGRLLTHVPYHLGQTFIVVWVVSL